MPLAVVSELLIHGGSLPQLAELDKASTTIYTKKNGVVFSLFWFIFFVPFMASIFGGVFGIDILGELFAVIGCFGALMIFIFSLAYLKRTPRPYEMSHYSQMGMNPGGLYPASNAALPPQREMPASTYAAPTTGSWRDTNDLEPASVTEGTTKLLEKDKKDQ